MLDPFPLQPNAWLSDFARTISPYLGFETLHLHIHEVLLTAIFYHLLCTYVSPVISHRLLPGRYSSFPRRTQINWDIHVVSFIQSIIISVLALWVIFADKERAEMDYRARIWGYTGASAMIQSFAAGYFLWDLYVSTIYVELFGLGLLAHAISALSVYMLGFRPFVNYYAPIFILYEISSPFLNIHWFFDKLDMTGSTGQLINGIFLMSSFFFCRLIWGTYQTVCVFGDIWNAMQYQDSAAGRAWLDGHGLASSIPGDKASHEIWRYSHGATVPFWLGSVYMVANTTLMALNVYWFGQMITAIRKRFDPPFGTRKPEKKKDVVLSRGLYDDGKKTVEIDSTEVKKRHQVKRVQSKGADHPPPT